MRMESDEFDFMAPTYVRGFLKNYARFLMIDPEPLVDEFDRRFGTGPVVTQEIMTMSRRGSTAARQPRHIPRWATIGLGILALLVLFALIGIASGDQEPTVTGLSDRKTADAPSPRPTKSPTPDATKSPKPKRNQSATALGKPFTVEIIAVYDRSYLEVEADGKDVFVGTLEQGDSETFRANQVMEILFGFPDGVELVVNGKHHLGTPTGGPSPNEIVLPRDFRRLLKS